MRLSIIIPSIGRSTLVSALAVLKPQLAAGDEVIVVCDGARPAAASAWASLDMPGIYAELPVSADRGATPRNHGMDRATGTHLLFIDDDDEHTPDALATVRAAAGGDAGGDKLHLFRMYYPATYFTVWDEPVLHPGNIGTPMILVPNRCDLPRWDTTHYGDYRFAAASAALLGPPEWHIEVIAHVRPSSCARARRAFNSQ